MPGIAIMVAIISGKHTMTQAKPWEKPKRIQSRSAAKPRGVKATLRWHLRIASPRNGDSCHAAAANRTIEPVTGAVIRPVTYQDVTFGVAPGAKLAAATVIEHGDTAARVIAGLEWCIGQGIKVVSLSLGVRQYEPLFSRIFQILRQRDILPVAAIGNEGAQTSRTPGNLPEVLSVGAMDVTD